MPIVPMPLHWRRRWQRGFNQSELLAREIARRWHVPVRQSGPAQKSDRAASRVDQRPAPQERAGGFRRSNPASRLNGQRILLIDDVLTTGATASACARALKRAGASQVTFLALARRDRRAAVEIEKPRRCRPRAVQGVDSP